MENQKLVDNFIIFMSALHHFGTDCKIDKKSKEEYLILIDNIKKLVENCQIIKNGCETCKHLQQGVCTYNNFNKVVPENIIEIGCKFINKKE